jgi:NADH-quinone oxidoreductase subunit N
MVQSIKGFVLMSVLLVLLISRGSFAQESIKKSQYSILVLTASLGLLMLIGTNDLVLMYLAIELQSLPFYTLASLKNDDEASTEAGLKYFVLGALSSGILLFGCSIIYGLSGLTNIAGLNYLLLGLGPTLDNLSVSTGLVIGILFIAVALLFKLGAAPFHV